MRTISVPWDRTPVTDHFPELIAALSNPAVYPVRPDSVQVLQTHISVVFIAGDLVYKIKKPVNFGFLDFTTREKRTYYCHREVALNSRFSKGIYLDVATIYRTDSGIDLTGPGEAIESAVVMRRIPEEALLISMVDRDRVTPELLDRISSCIAYFHAQAERGPQIDAFGSPRVIRNNVTENFVQTEPYISRTIDRSVYDETRALSIQFLAENEPLFTKRVQEGFIRDCHGDLHLDHVIVLDEIMLLDCIEFNDRFRYGDTASDLAFLLMDFEYRGYPAFADRVSKQYAAASGDEDALKLLGFYKSYRAFVRGKVIGFTLDEPEVPEQDKAAAAMRARSYFDLALANLKAPPEPVLIVTCGLMGSGKSFIAEKLGKRLGITPIRSDVLRKRMYGLSPAEHQLDNYREGFYTSGATERTYQALLADAREALTRGSSVILDASFARYEDRVRAARLALDAGARFRIVCCWAPDKTIHARLVDRSAKSNEPSDGRWEIFSQHKSDFENIREDEKKHCRTWDSTGDTNTFLREFVRELTFDRNISRGVYD
ncbi:AAA family ATPase [Desulfomonile tiedjei]|uniref:Aminoglycoside phosphotransferase domain-containing protein n=1 Tax=Desulfomonile tiedjei (strain ATCC 49306 / DSM 6799 / DCB-1) TaxID=706587 RepID=I4C2Q0_DESTA|nr:bifunctional aminoglycoside phosphotransferase/ATP-binding protein [Desulfomonile tiedjei]AFM23841.1 hypothetical protein Desti_1127 [Desulfomonile tiedjei DSM 6799]